MSLLLKALKQAEAAQTDKSGASRRTDGELDLEPLVAPAGGQRDWVEPPGLLFGSSGLAPQPPHHAPAFRWPRLSLVSTTALLAMLIALGYGVYLYFALQPPASTLATDVGATAPVAAVLPAEPTRLPAPVVVQPTAAQTEALAVSPTLTALAPPSRPVPPRPATRDTSPARVSPPAAPPLFQPDALNAVLAQAYAAYQRGALDDAQRLYAQAAAANRSADALLGLAAIASLQNREAEAQRLYRDVLDLDPRNATAQGALLDLLGNTDSLAAESRLKTLIERDPSPQLHQTLGNLYADQKRWGEAQAAYFEAVRGAPDNADYAFNLAVSLDQLRQFKAALAYYEKALASGGAHRFDRAQAEARVQQLRAIR